MLGAIPHVVVLDDVLDAHELRLAGFDLLDQVSEVAVGLAATALDLIVELAVAWDCVDDQGESDEIFPVGGYWGASV